VLRGKPYGGNPWCLDPQEEAQQSLRLIQDNSLTPSHVQLFYAQMWDRSRLQIIYLFNKLRLSGFELETSDSDTMLNYYVPTNSTKSLSY
jgi:hypothetical protein